LSAGELLGELVALVGKANRVQELEHPCPACAGWSILYHDEWILDVFKGGQHWDEVEALKDEADMVAAKRGGLPPGESRHIDAGDLQVAACRLIQTANEVEQRGFAAP
jgi:hypothetical protein